uniref:Uncharacterized protein n=1 Tax=Nelumbo nucifera TaxID=4432 RepID=A0A822Z130_NELNU|nr:TPA_asm: hypothetical protein HUJ06_008022 [Nelumbo nucifera]
MMNAILDIVDNKEITKQTSKGKYRSVVLWSIHDPITTSAANTKSPGFGSSSILHTAFKVAATDKAAESPVGPHGIYHGHGVEDVQSVHQAEWGDTSSTKKLKSFGTKKWNPVALKPGGISIWCLNVADIVAELCNWHPASGETGKRNDRGVYRGLRSWTTLDGFKVLKYIDFISNLQFVSSEEDVYCKD